jgi:hypothetical protein
MLLGKRTFERDLGTASRRRIAHGDLQSGPLGLFLNGTIERRRRGEDGDGVLHVINVRDWRIPNDSYDGERRVHGRHGERGTWGAAYLEGLERYLDPGGAQLSEEARYFEEGSVRIHHVHTDSFFDFRPRSEHLSFDRKFQKSAIEVLLDVILQGSDEDLEKMRALLAVDGRPAALWELSREIDLDEQIRFPGRVYLAVIGVPTDIKVATFLNGLHTIYHLPNVAVSDTLTASSEYELHVAALNFADKVLGVEVSHGINDLVSFLGGSVALESENEIVATPSFEIYRSYVRNRQDVFAYETAKLRDYLNLTERRAVDVYETVKRSNRFLLLWGGGFLTATLVLSIAAAVAPERIDWRVPAITAGVSLAQFVGAFFSQPVAELQQNLSNFAVFKMIVESHSLKTAFARFQLTTKELLSPATEREHRLAERQIETLRDQLKVIENIDREDLNVLLRLGFVADQGRDGVSDQAATTAESHSLDDGQE